MRRALTLGLLLLATATSASGLERADVVTPRGAALSGDLLKSIDTPHARSLISFEYYDNGLLKARREQRNSAPDALTEYLYLPNGVVQIADAEGTVTKRTLLASGQVAREEVLMATPVVMERFWEGSLLKSETRSEGSWTAGKTLTYSPRGRLLESNETFSAGGRDWTAKGVHAWTGKKHTIKHTWTLGSMAASPDATLANVDVVEDIIDVDALGLPVRHQRGVLIDEFVNDAVGRQVRRHPSNSATTLFKYGSDGRLASTEFGSPAEVTKLKYDRRGRIHQLDAPHGLTEYAYDGRGLVLSQTYRGFTTSSTYDDEGNLATRTVGGQPTSFAYGPQGELLTTTLPDSTVWTYEYDKLARLAKVVPPVGPLLEQQWTYDGLGRVKTHLDGTNTWTTNWVNGAAVTSLPDSLGTVTSLSDSRGRLLSLSGSGGAHRSVESYSFFYTGLDELRFAHEAGAPGARSNASSTYARDASRRLTGTGRNGDNVTFAFDGLSARVLTKSHAGVTVTKGYDSYDRLSSLQGPWGTTAVAWEAGGQRLKSLSDSLVTEGFCYDSEGRIASIRGGTDCASSPVRLSYGYDARGNPTSESDGVLTRRFAYDVNDRLIATQEWSGEITAWKLHADGSRAGEKQFPAGSWPTVGAPAFTDPGHTRERAYTYNANGALGTVADITVASSPVTVGRWDYDAAGRVTSRTVNGHSTAPTWDVFGRMTSSGGLSFEYDGQGMRRSAVGVGLAPRQFTYIGESLVAEDGQPHVAVGPYAVAQGGVRFAHDALGSVVSQVSASASSTATFAVWGKQSGGPQLTSVGFTGYLEEPLAGAKFAKQRWADDEFGIFLSRDPKGAASYLSTPNGFGPWSYANLGPARYTDPDGRFTYDKEGNFEIQESDSTERLMLLVADLQMKEGLEFGEFAKRYAAQSDVGEAYGWGNDEALTRATLASTLKSYFGDPRTRGARETYEMTIRGRLAYFNALHGADEGTEATKMVAGLLGYPVDGKQDVAIGIAVPVVGKLVKVGGKALWRALGRTIGREGDDALKTVLREGEGLYAGNRSWRSIPSGTAEDLPGDVRRALEGGEPFRLHDKLCQQRSHVRGAVGR